MGWDHGFQRFEQGLTRHLPRFTTMGLHQELERLLTYDLVRFRSLAWVTGPSANGFWDLRFTGRCSPRTIGTKTDESGGGWVRSGGRSKGEAGQEGVTWFQKWWYL